MLPDWRQLRVNDADVALGKQFDLFNKMERARNAPFYGFLPRSSAQPWVPTAQRDAVRAPASSPEMTEWDGSRGTPSGNPLEGGLVVGGIGALGSLLPATKYAAPIARFVAESALKGSLHPAALAAGAGLGSLLDSEGAVPGALKGAAYMASPVAAAALSPSDAVAGALSTLARLSKGTGRLPMRASQEGVVKLKGGNWLNGSVEDALRGLKQQVISPETEARIYPNGGAGTEIPRSLNSWIEGPLTKYVKTRMASPDDEVRKLAEQGVLHFDVGPQYWADWIKDRQVLGNSELAKNWEILADSEVWTGAVGAPKEFSATELANNSWMGKVPAGTPVHDISNPSGMVETLGFDHLIDELRNALNPDSGLPRHLQLSPEAVQKMSMEKAVRRVSDINAWRAAQAAAADMEKMRANLTQKPLKEYEGGWRWVELPDPEASPENMKLVKDIGCQGGWCTQGDSAATAYGAHSRGNRLYALIDKDGRPHIQVQTASAPRNIGQQDIPDRFLDDAMERLGIDTPEAQFGREEEIDALASKLFAEANPEAPPRILQIKPFSNSWDSQMVRDFTKKNPNYRKEIEPMVQDFVRNSPLGSAWSDVGDLQNAGLRKLPDGRYITEQQLNAALQKVTPEGETPPPTDWFMRQINKDPSWWENAKGAFEGFAKGGIVGWPVRQQKSIVWPVRA